MVYLSLCAIMKDESPYIREWLLFHLEVGVEHFYLYDNGITCGTAEVIKSVTSVRFAERRSHRTHWQIRDFRGSLLGWI